MFGPNVRDMKLKGIIPRAASQVYASNFNYLILPDIWLHIERWNRVEICAESFFHGDLQRYNFPWYFILTAAEKLRDLLQPKVSDQLKVRESPDRGVYVENLTEVCLNYVRFVVIEQLYRSASPLWKILWRWFHMVRRIEPLVQHAWIKYALFIYLFIYYGLLSF